MVTIRKMKEAIYTYFSEALIYNKRRKPKRK